MLPMLIHGFRCVLTLTLVFFASLAPAMIVVSSGPASDADDFGVRFKSLRPTGSNEHYLGVPDLGVSGNRVEQAFGWSGSTTFAFTLDYTPGTDTLTSTLGGGTPLNYTFTPDLDIDVLQITVADRDADGELWLSDLSVNGESVPDFTDSSSEGFLDFNLTNLPAATGLSITGTINRTGVFSNSDERSRIEIRAGGSVAAIPEPSLVAVWGLGAAACVAASRRRRQQND